MFQSTQHLPQRLSREHYTSPEIYQRELERMFLPGWHCIGALTDAPRIGDFFTAELFDHPLVCWHTSRGFQTFLNVCTHRYCTLTDKLRGRFGERMKCQYHGWEYDESGNTCKIPDAQSFRPLKKGELGLREYRTEMVGQLIFATLNEQAAPLADYLGPKLTEWCQTYFSPRHRLTYLGVMEIDSNWKVVAENVIEAYHLATVHPGSFGGFPPSERCEHEFHPTYSYYRNDCSDHPMRDRAERLLARLSQREPKLYWDHFIRYPNLTCGGAGPWNYLQIILPTGPTTCRAVSYTMHDTGPKGRIWPFLIHRLVKRIGTAMGLKINREDANLYPSIYRGITSAQRPHGGGLISAREERVFALQDYVLRMLDSDAPHSVTSSLPPLEAPGALPPVLQPVALDADS